MDPRPKPVPYFTKMRSKDGGYIPVKVDWLYLPDEKDTVQCILSVLHYHPSW